MINTVRNTTLAGDDMLCPKCGCNREALLELANSEDWMAKSYAWIIAENCSECKEWLNEQYKLPETPSTSI